MRYGATSWAKASSSPARAAASSWRSLAVSSARADPVRRSLVIASAPRTRPLRPRGWRRRYAIPPALRAARAAPWRRAGARVRCTPRSERSRRRATRAAAGWRIRRSRRRSGRPRRRRDRNHNSPGSAPAASAGAARRTCSPAPGRRCAVPGGRSGAGSTAACASPLSLAAEDRVGADLGERADDGGFVAAVGDVFLEALERPQIRERAWSIVVVCGEVEEIDAVIEPEGGVVKAGRLRLIQLRVDGADELLVLGRALGLDPVANDELLHCETSS